jgi:hypothetical protein
MGGRLLDTNLAERKRHINNGDDGEGEEHLERKTYN